MKIVMKRSIDRPTPRMVSIRTNKSVIVIGGHSPRLLGPCPALCLRPAVANDECGAFFFRVTLTKHTTGDEARVQREAHVA